MEKEVKEGQKKLAAPKPVKRSDEIDVSSSIKRYPKVKKSLVDSTIKGMEVKKTKLEAKHSKRTTPGEVEHKESTPAHAKVENERWEKTKEIKSKGKGKSLTAKLQKRNGKGGKGK